MAEAKLLFAFMAAAGIRQHQALMLVESIRAFAGPFAASPIWILVPQSDTSLSGPVRDRLAALDTRLVPFPMDPASLGFPFAAKVQAAAVAERLASAQSAPPAWTTTECLVWMDADALVLQDTTALLLPPGKSLGFRPVDHTLIGSLHDQPIDPFWDLIYRHCHVSTQGLSRMTTSVDRRQLRPYFNAGLLVVRPTRGLLSCWRDDFLRLYQHADFQPFYAENSLYRIFIHQAVLAGTVLGMLDAQELAQLPDRVNYPLHMHADYPADRRPVYLNDLISCRYDTLLQDAGWRGVIPIREPLKTWLNDRLRASGLDNGER